MLVLSSLSPLFAVQDPSPWTVQMNQVPWLSMGGWSFPLHLTQRLVSFSSLDVVKPTLSTITPISVSLGKLPRGALLGRREKVRCTEFSWQI